MCVCVCVCIGVYDVCVCIGVCVCVCMYKCVCVFSPHRQCCSGLQPLCRFLSVSAESSGPVPCVVCRLELFAKYLDHRKQHGLAL